MLRHLRTAVAVFAVLAITAVATASEIQGVYLESRTCQVYTGPCFANGETGLAGRGAILAWQIQKGERDGIDLAGLNVVMVVNAPQTLGFQGMKGMDVKSMILVDERANPQQREALIDFARDNSGPAGKNVVRVQSKPIKMELDTAALKGTLEAGKTLKVATRKTKATDCICGNEAAYYPPLAKVTNFAPGVALENEFKGYGLGRRWSDPGGRSAYMATFDY